MTIIIDDDESAGYNEIVQVLKAHLGRAHTSLHPGAEAQWVQ